MPGELGALRLGKVRRGIDFETLRRIGPGILAPDLPIGVTRDEVTVPISPDGRVDDTVLFEDPADPTRRHYLPRYRLRVAPATGRYEITTALLDGQWRMTFGLESFPAEEIQAAGDAPAILPHELSIKVSSGSGLAREYPVAEFSPGFSDTGVRPEVVLLLTLAERDALLRAFTSDEERARIEVLRTITVAVPAAPPRPRLNLMMAVAVENLGTPVILPDLVLPTLVTFAGVSINRPEPVPDPPGEPEPDPRAGVPLRSRLLDVDAGLHLVERGGTGLFRQALVVDEAFARSAAVTDVGTKALTFQKPKFPGILRRTQLDAGGVREALRRGGVFSDDRFPFPVPEPFPFPDPAPTPEPAPVQRYSVVSSTHGDDVMLRFDVAAHPYLFPSGQPVGSDDGFSTLVVPWPEHDPSSRNHVYFHDEAAGNVFYYLPDTFLIGQRNEAPYGPELSFTVGRTTEADGGAERAIALISVHLVPQTSQGRLFDAAAALAEHVVAGSGEPDLRPAVHPATCRLELPGAAITTSTTPDLVNGWWVAESFAFDDLRDVYAVLTTDGATRALLRGRVDVDVMGQVHQVPVELRLDRLASPALLWSEEQGLDAIRSVTVTLSNEGDVALEVPALQGWVSRGAQPVRAAVTSDLPTQLLPGASVVLKLEPESLPNGLEDSQGILDLSPVRAVIDPEHAVEQTLDRRVARLPRVVTVLTTEGGLGLSGDPERDLALIVLEFASVSGVVKLDRSTLQAEIAVPVPLVDWLLDRGSGVFQYKQTLVHLSGSSQSDRDWRSVDAGVLVLPQPAVP